MLRIADGWLRNAMSKKNDDSTFGMELWSPECQRKFNRKKSVIVRIGLFLENTHYSIFPIVISVDRRGSLETSQSHF